MRIIIDNSQDEVLVSNKLIQIIKRSINRTLKYENFKKRAEVSVILVDNEQIRELNREHRNIDKATDVLSFPIIDFSIEQDDKYDYDRGYLMLGDIIISMEKAVEQAEEYGHSIEREVGFLCVHSALHLLGYDHDNEEDTKEMRSKEDAVLEEIDLKR